MAGQGFASPKLDFGRMRDESVRFHPVPNRLEVKKVRYGSPGITDLAGVGKIHEELRKFVELIIETTGKRRETQLTNERRELENLELFLKIQKEHSSTTEDLESLKEQLSSKQKRFKKLVLENKLIAVRKSVRVSNRP